jgi:quinol monooxygenase YgiN
MKIYLTAVIKSKPEYREEVKAALLNMVQHSRKEAACLQYDLHQGNDDKDLFTFHEIWESAAGLDEHNAQPYIKAFGELVPVKLQEPPLIYKGTLL